MNDGIRNQGHYFKFEKKNLNSKEDKIMHVHPIPINWRSIVVFLFFFLYVVFYSYCLSLYSSDAGRQVFDCFLRFRYLGKQQPNTFLWAPILYSQNKKRLNIEAAE